MRTLFFCGGCSILIASDELAREPDAAYFNQCINCCESYDEKIPGQFTEENASRLETAATDQTSGMLE